MTPAEIRLLKEHITQKTVEDLAVYLDNWMKFNKQPDKQCIITVKAMKADRIPPDEQANQILSSLVDWFAYGN